MSDNERVCRTRERLDKYFNELFECQDRDEDYRISDLNLQIELYGHQEDELERCQAGIKRIRNHRGCLDAQKELACKCLALIEEDDEEEAEVRLIKESNACMIYVDQTTCSGDKERTLWSFNRDAQHKLGIIADKLEMREEVRKILKSRQAMYGGFDELAFLESKGIAPPHLAKYAVRGRPYK